MSIHTTLFGLVNSTNSGVNLSDEGAYLTLSLQFMKFSGNKLEKPEISYFLLFSDKVKQSKKRIEKCLTTCNLFFLQQQDLGSSAAEMALKELCNDVLPHPNPNSEELHPSLYAIVLFGNRILAEQGELQEVYQDLDILRLSTAFALKRVQQLNQEEVNPAQQAVGFMASPLDVTVVVFSILYGDLSLFDAVQRELDNPGR